MHFVRMRKRVEIFGSEKKEVFQGKSSEEKLPSNVFVFINDESSRLVDESYRHQSQQRSFFLYDQRFSLNRYADARDKGNIGQSVRLRGISTDVYFTLDYSSSAKSKG